MTQIMVKTGNKIGATGCCCAAGNLVLPAVSGCGCIGNPTVMTLDVEIAGLTDNGCTNCDTDYIGLFTFTYNASLSTATSCYWELTGILSVCAPTARFGHVIIRKSGDQCFITGSWSYSNVTQLIFEEVELTCPVSCGGTLDVTLNLDYAIGNNLNACFYSGATMRITAS